MDECDWNGIVQRWYLTRAHMFDKSRQISTDFLKTSKIENISYEPILSFICGMWMTKLPRIKSNTCTGRSSNLIAKEYRQYFRYLIFNWIFPTARKRNSCNLFIFLCVCSRYHARNSQITAISEMKPNHNNKHGIKYLVIEIILHFIILSDWLPLILCQLLLLLSSIQIMTAHALLIIIPCYSFSTCRTQFMAKRSRYWYFWKAMKFNGLELSA